MTSTRTPSRKTTSKRSIATFEPLRASSTHPPDDPVAARVGAADPPLDEASTAPRAPRTTTSPGARNLVAPMRRTLGQWPRTPRDLDDGVDEGRDLVRRVEEVRAHA